MNKRAMMPGILSFACGLALVVLLVRLSGLDAHTILVRWSVIDKRACAGVLGMMAVSAYISAWKWRLTERALRTPSEQPPAHFEYFALTSIGSALGQILPVQLSMPAIRTLGTRLHGGAFRRGTLATFVEQSFDVFFACFLMAASAATYVLHRGAVTWFLIAVPGAALSIVLGGEFLKAIRQLTRTMATKYKRETRLGRFAAELAESPLLDALLGRKLMALSALRFVVFVLIAAESSSAIRAGIPLWHFAAATPFALLAVAAGITPGGLGLTEFTYVGVLSRLGTPLGVATEWALINRLMVSGSALLIGMSLLPILVAFRAARATSHIRGKEAACLPHQERQLLSPHAKQPEEEGQDGLGTNGDRQPRRDCRGRDARWVQSAKSVVLPNDNTT